MSNRVIKFRAWDTATNSYLDDFLMWSSSLCDGVQVSVDKVWCTGDVILQQFTGLYDTEGKEIYEGDIVSCSEDKVLRVVEWCDESCSFLIRSLPNEPYAENYFMDELDMSVVTNTFENP